MTDGFWISRLGGHLARQHRELMNVQHATRTADSAAYSRLADKYNRLVDDYNALQKHARELRQWADAQIAAEKERADNASASADYWRGEYDNLFARTLKQ